jgi:anti-sigma B factor antagonist
MFAALPLLSYPVALNRCLRRGAHVRALGPYACLMANIDDPSVTFTVVREDLAGGVASLRLAGELDLAAAPTLGVAIDEVLAGGGTRILVNLRDVTFCDSTGLSAFVRGHHLTTAAGGWLRVTGAQGTVSRVLHISGLDELLETDEVPGT